MATTSPQADFPAGAVNGKRRKEELVAIAKTIGLTPSSKGGWTKDSKERIVKMINKELETHPELANNPALQGYIFSSQKDVAEEDAAAATDVMKPVTGANKELHELNITSDPPPRHGRLRTNGSQPDELHGSAPVGHELALPCDEYISPASSPPGTPLATGEGAEEDSDLPGTVLGARKKPSDIPRTPIKQVGVRSGTDGGKATVIVLFLNPDDPKAPAEDVYIEESRQLKLERTLHEGSEHVFVRLSKLVPIAIQQAGTPMKGCQACVLRASIRSDSGYIDLGSIEAITEGKQVKQLEMRKVDRYMLEPIVDEDDTFVCWLFLRDIVKDTTSTASGPAPSVAAPQVGLPTARVPAASIQDSPSDSNNPGTGNDLITFLQQLLGGPRQPWRKAKLAGDILERQKMLEAAMEMLEDLEWGKPKGGYKIPEDYSEAGSLVGVSLVKHDVLRALHLGHSQVSDDSALLKKDVLAQVPKIRDWYEKGAKSQYADQFHQMSIREFRNYQERKLGEAKGKGYKRKLGASDHNDDHDDEHAEKKKRQKGKERYMSSDLIKSESDSD
ncbi:hypothetical protein C8Q80DRAFT_1274606 [Daedaleopsis nitida]|nr:hypothetical protein C8Q80DRAFT_1274606 [Daedaleopsis nitida]